MVKMQEILSPAEAGIFTDHCVLNFDILLSPNIPPKIRRTVYDYRRGDLDALRRCIESRDLASLITTDGDIDEDWSCWKSAFLRAVNEHIPTKSFRSRHRVPWINGDILYQIKKKNTIRKRLKRTPTEHLLNRFKSMRTLVKRMMKESRRTYINSLCNDRTINTKRFWSLFKLKSKRASVPGTISVVNNDGCARSCADNPIDIANMFNRYFVSIFNFDMESDEINELQSSEMAPVLTDIELTEDMVHSILSNLDSNKAHGPDQIPARLLRHRAKLLLHLLLSLINLYDLANYPLSGNLRTLFQFSRKVTKNMLRTTDLSHSFL